MAIQQEPSPDSFKTSRVKGVISSTLLTVWRKLYIEVDSMKHEPLPTDADYGVSKSPDIQKLVVQAAAVNQPNLGQTTLTVATLEGQVDQFEGGFVWVSEWDSSLMKYRVISNGVGSRGNVPIVINRALAEGEITIIRSSPHVYITDDDKSEAQLPYYPAVSPIVKNIYAQIYVLPEVVDESLNPRKEVDFDLNISENGEWLGPSGSVHNDAKDLSSEAKYWVVLLTTGYQYDDGEDGDPDPHLDNNVGDGKRFGKSPYEESTTGITDRDDNEAVIFKEIIHDARKVRGDEPTTEAYVIAHELGHSGDIGNDSTQIMDEQPSNWGGPTSAVFSDKDKAFLRGKKQW